MTLRTYFDDKFADLEKRLAMRDELTEKAIAVAERDLSRRLEGMNEFRSQLTSQAANFIDREEFEIHMARIEDKISALSKIVYIGIGVMLVLQFAWKFI